jgi:hypothetical protein
VKLFLACFVALNPWSSSSVRVSTWGSPLARSINHRFFPPLSSKFSAGFRPVGVLPILKGQRSAGGAALTANPLAFAGILLGVLAPALRQRTWPVIAPDHRIMLVLIGAWTQSQNLAEPYC